MNNSDFGEKRRDVAQSSGARSRKARRVRDMAGARRSVKGGGTRGASLSIAAERLLMALSEPHAEGMIDRTAPGMVLIRKMRNGVSVGAGRFAKAAAEDLTRHDLAHWSREATPALRITKTGQAHRRRREVGETDSFLHQHLETTEASIATRDGSVRVRVDVEESPLDWLRRRKDRNGEPMIDAASYEAGERLRRDITLAGLLPSITARWDAPKGGGPAGPAEATDRMIAARQRIRHAFEALGSDFSDLLIDLCGFLKGIELIEQERGWPPRSAKVVIRLALARLAEHYGLTPLACGPQASRGIRTWQAVVIDGGLAGA